MSLKKVVKDLYLLHARLADTVDREYPRGMGIEWMHCGHPQYGHVLKNYTFGDDVKLLVKNRATGKEVRIRYSRDTGWYS